MGELKGTAPKEFLEQVEKITRLARERKVLLRLVGALAFNLHCPEYNHFHIKLKRVFTDIDFASRVAYLEPIRDLFRELGWDEDVTVTTLYGSERMIFNDPKSGLHSDIFFDKLDFCHVLPLADRLEADPLTIPLAELFLEKSQIVKINEKDIIDIIMLLREHPVGDSDDETVNGKVIARICANDWGFWRTTVMNMEKVRGMLEVYEGLTAEDKQTVSERLQQIQDLMDQEPKPLSWKMRNRVGDRVKWWKDVDDL